MCGLTGFVDFTKKSGEFILNSMNKAIQHRGPDDQGSVFHQCSNFQLGLAHSRLSIVDLSAHGHQPMKFGNLEIVYNGEVYNFREIRLELEKVGYQFSSESDTEVILKAFDRWGHDAVTYFRGMFVFVIFNAKAEKLYMYRDRSGIKPFFYRYEDGCIVFGSELKSLCQHPSFKKNINKDAIVPYLQHGYIPEPSTIYLDCFKLTPGHYLELDLVKRTLEKHSYWDVYDYYNGPKLDISYQEATDTTHNILKKAFEYRMVADVPVGVFLSGGYDSVAVASVLQGNTCKRLKTYTIGFEDKRFNEAHHAKEVAEHLGTEHTEIICTDKDAQEVVPLLASMFDEPFADVSAIPTYLVSYHARKEVTVALSADGGDETFAGYDKYRRALHYQKYSRFKPLLNALSVFTDRAKTASSLAQKIQRLNAVANRESRESPLRSIVFPSSSYIKKLIKFDTKHVESKFDTHDKLNGQNDFLNKLLAVDYKTYMVDDVLTKVDRTTMAVSLEGREPLLDHKIIEFAAQLPSTYKLRDGVSKSILKDIVHQYVPKSMMDRPKQGFGVPIDKWLAGEMNWLIEEFLSKRKLVESDVFNIEEVNQLKKSFLENPNCTQSAKLIWNIICFQMWFGNSF